MHTSTDAIEWCANHTSNGTYTITYGIITEPENGQYVEGDICCTFRFSNKEDYTLFCVTWG